MTTLTGSCNCKAVTFTVRDPRPEVAACHCGQCRKQTGHHWASSTVQEENLDVKGDVRWFDVTETASRGFCPTCGCFLFWKAHAETKISFSAGAIDGPTRLYLARHIFVADKGDYYDISDDLPQRAQ